MWALYVIGYLLAGVVSTTVLIVADEVEFDESDGGLVFLMFILWPVLLIGVLWYVLFVGYIGWAKGLRNGGWRNFLTKNKGD